MNAIKQYVNAVERRLRLDRQTKLRVMNDLASDLQSRLDAGETLAEIEADLGSPAELAANLNAAFPEHQRPASPWRWLFAAAAALLALWMALASMPAQTSGIIGGADGPTAIVVTASGPDFSLFGLFCALAAAFLFLGWCRCGRPRRYGAAIALSAVCLALAALRLPALFAAQHAFSEGGGTAAAALSSIWLPALLRSGVWLALPVLVFALRRMRAAGHSAEKAR